MAEIAARLNAGEGLGDRILKVVHAGEHGAVNIYRGQRIGAFPRPRALRDELADFQAAIAVATVAVERVVLRHLEAYREALAGRDPEAVRAIDLIAQDERDHHDRFAAEPANGPLLRALDAAVGFGTEKVIWAGMRLWARHRPRTMK